MSIEELQTLNQILTLKERESYIECEEESLKNIDQCKLFSKKLNCLYYKFLIQLKRLFS